MEKLRGGHKKGEEKRKRERKTGKAAIEIKPLLLLETANINTRNKKYCKTTQSKENHKEEEQTKGEERRGKGGERRREMCRRKRKGRAEEDEEEEEGNNSKPSACD